MRNVRVVPRWQEAVECQACTIYVLLCAKSLKARHIASNEAYGRLSVAFEPGYNIGLRVGNCSFTAIRTSSNTTSVPGE